MRKALIISLFTMAAIASAADDKKVVIDPKQEVSVTGTGCKKDTYSIIYLEDRSGFTIGFNDYKLELTGEDQKNKVTKKDIACQITIPLHIPKQLRITSVSAEYEGFASLPTKAAINFFNQYRFFFAGAPPAVESVGTLKGPVERSFTTKDNLTIVSAIKSPCGKAANMIVKGRMQLVNENKEKSASVTVDAFNLTLEEKKKLKIYATYRWEQEACKE